MKARQRLSKFIRRSILAPSLAFFSLPGHADHHCLLDKATHHKSEPSQLNAGLIKPCAENGDAKAQLMLGKIFYSGLGVNKDDHKAAKWFRKAADQGLADAQYQLGLLYVEGDGVEENKGAAIDWLYLAAQQGHEYAQFVYNNLINEDFTFGC